MKKVLFPILVVVLALGLTLPAAAHTEDDPSVTDLIAGGGNPKSAVDVGDVNVWNDGDNLYVKYVVDASGWCLTETHLHVATSMEAIPQKNGNPPPGQFDYKTEHDCVTEYTYVIDLDEEWPPCTDLYIAAHADVQKLSDVITASFATGDGIDTVIFIAEDIDNPGYPEPYGNTPTASVVIEGTIAGYSGWPTITGAQWISDSLANPGSANSWRLFTRIFSIPSNATNISGTLHIDSDNAEEAKINGSPAAGLVYGEVYGAFTDNQEWKTVLSWPVGSYLQPGDNTLGVMVRNYYWVPTPGMWNYTGLIYKMDYEYQLPFTETAWGAGVDFPGRNWATYFTYHVQGLEGLVGDWLLSYVQLPPGGGTYNHNMSITTQNQDGSFSGTGNYPTGPMWTWNVTGTVTDNTVSMTITYDQSVGGTYPYIVSLTGTVGASGSSMSGTATDNRGHSYTWTATRVP